MKKLKLFISLWFTMFSMVVFGQAEYEKIAITQNTQDNTAGRLLVQDVTTGEVRWILKSILDNKFNQPTGNATQYLDGAGTPTTFPVLGQSDRVITEVRNSTGATITKGTVVYLNGATGGKPNVLKAQANAEATSSGTFGVIQSDINNNSNGYVVVIGTVLGLNTSAYTAGQVLWLSPTTAGGFTTTKPVAPNHAVYVGIVTLAATQGTIEVKIQNGYELDEIHDVLITSKTDNDGLIYESASGLWKNKQITKAMVGLANVDNTSDLNKPISTATQTALNLKENTANKNTANGYAGLGSDGKLISSQLPAITITDTFVVGSQAAMLALTAETGDVAVRTDVNKSFILKGTSAGTLADWQELLTPTSSVTSVFGRQGAVTANNGDYTTALVTETTNKRYQTDIQQTYNDATSSIQTQLNSKANDNAVVHLAGSESVTGAKTFTATPSFDNNIFLKHLSSWSSPAGYTVIGGRTDGFLLSASSTKTALIGLGNLTQAWTYDFPNKAGTFAMTSDVPTISGTTNYIPKFTGASAIGNSAITDDGTTVALISRALSGTSATFSSSVRASGLLVTDDRLYIPGNLPIANWLSSSLTAGHSSTNSYSWVNGAGNLVLGTDGSERMRITSGGNVEIKNSDSRLLGGNTSGRLIVSNSDTSSYFSINGSANATPNSIGVITNSEITFNTGASYSERMRINTSGDVSMSDVTSVSSRNIGVPLNNSGWVKLCTIHDNSVIKIIGKVNSNNSEETFTIDINTTYYADQSLISVTRKTYNPLLAEIRVAGVSHGVDKIVYAKFRASENAPTVNWHVIGSKGVVAINNTLTTPTESLFNTLTVTGDSTFSTNANTIQSGTATFTNSVTATAFFQSSDLRLKDIISRDGDVIKYKWKDKRDDKIHIGYVAQEVQKENPDQVNADDKGILSVNYIEILVQKIKDLENRIKQLEK